MANQLVALRTIPYAINKANFIRQALAGYVGGSAIFSEMVQNADDAGATRISFHFTRDALIVRNDSLFSDQDIINITDIASGGKRDEEGKIGTWGTGFLSVFHLTDAPELHSAGQRIEFDPTKNDLPVYPSTITDSTEFRLPWRSNESALGRHIEAKVWTREDINDLRTGIGPVIYRLIIFLRRVRVIEVFEGDAQEKLVARVERRLLNKEPQLKPGTAVADLSVYHRERWSISYQSFGTQPRTDIWLYYCAEVPPRLRVGGLTIKDPEVSLAFPLESRDWLNQHLPGSLYNFLPTPIETGYPFQINGAFFPDNNRRNILIDHSTQGAKAAWNLRVLDMLAQLFSAATLDIRDQVRDPRRFYELLPIVESKETFLKPIYRVFAEAARGLPIVFTSLKDWRHPQDVFIGLPGSKLPALASDYIAVLPAGATEAFRRFLHEVMKSPQLNWEHIVAFLRAQDLTSGVALTATHPMIRGSGDRPTEKIELLYAELPGQPTAGQRQLLADVPLFLAEDGTLWRYSQLWRADQTTRNLLKGFDIRFADIEFQRRRAVETLVTEFRGAELVRLLATHRWLDKPFGIAEEPLFASRLHLEALLTFIGKDLANVDEAELAGLPIVCDEAERLYRGSSLVYRHSDQGERRALGLLGLAFVHPELVTKPAAWEVYQKAGVGDLGPRDVIAALQAAPLREPEQISEDFLEQLVATYRYFVRQSDALTINDREALRRIPICLTQQGKLLSVQGTLLHLPPVGSLGDDRLLTHLSRLQLDNLIHGQIIRRGGGVFLTQVMKLHALTSINLIVDILLPHYHDHRLDDSARSDLMHYMSEQTRNLSDEKQVQLWPRLRMHEIVQCADGQYRRGEEVYFASSALDAVFGTEYHRLHPDYGVPVAQPEDADQTPYRRNVWYWLFENLGVRETPALSDVVRTVQRAVTGTTPTEDRVVVVKRIYDLLNRLASQDKAYLSDPAIANLTRIAWLPARNEPHNRQWHLPSQIYQASMVELIGEHKPLLRFEETVSELRRALGMAPSPPPVRLIAQHLLASARDNRPVRPRVYAELGRHWDDSDLRNSGERQQLREKPVVWVNSRYWAGRHVFLGDYSRQFGHRRCYLRTVDGDVLRFFEYINTKHGPDPWKDTVEILNEIAAEYGSDRTLDQPDLQIVLYNLDQLGGLDSLSNAQITELRQLAVVPDQEGKLHLPSRIVFTDQRGYLEQFDHQVPAVIEKKLTEAAERLLRRLRVPLLSEVIQRRLSSIDGKHRDDTLGDHIRQLAPAFQRIALTVLKDDDDLSTEELPIVRLERVRLYICTRLMVEYVLDDGQGWHIQGQCRDEAALYDGDQSIFVKQSAVGQIPYVQLARELERVLFPNTKESVVIEQLLRLPISEVHGYLDEHGYRQLPEFVVIPEIVSENATTGVVDLPIDAVEPERHAQEADGNGEIGAAALHNQQASTASNGNKQTDAGGGETSPMSAANVVQHDGTAPTNGAAHDGEQKIDDSKLGEAGISTHNGADDTRNSKPIDQTIGKGTVDADQGDRTNRIKKQAIPPFTGQKRPVVALLPNNYGELSEKFGLQRHGQVTSEIGQSSQVSEDNLWDEKSRPNTGTSIIRFTLTFTNRYEGFLPLNTRARQMLTQAKQPRILRCLTDFDNWAFELYVDYHEGVIYSKNKKLVSFFDAYNIPAGGIVYLERLPGNTVKLFWKRMSSSIEKVRCLELREDGTLMEYEIPAIDVPCEVSEYVLRAEQRLADQGALLKQALSQRGLFQTICEVFGRPHADLSYAEIFRDVMMRRMVASGSLDHELRRPCFVKIGQDRWRFEPERGSEPQKTTSTTGTGPSSYNQLLANLQREWEVVGSFLRANDRSVRDRVDRLAQYLVNLGKRLQRDVSTLATIEQDQDVQAYIDLAKESTTAPERFALWREAWERFPGEAQLRRAIHHDVSTSCSEIKQQISTITGQGKVVEAATAYTHWMEHIHPLAEVWRSDSVAQQITAVGCVVITSLVEAVRGHPSDPLMGSHILAVAAQLPVDNYLPQFAVPYLDALRSVAEQFERQQNPVAGIALLEYGARIVDPSTVSPPNDPALALALYHVLGHVARLYEQLHVYDRALAHLDSVPKGSLPSQYQNELSHHRYRLRTSNQPISPQPIRMEQVLSQTEFRRLVNVAIFQRIMERLSE